MMKLSRDNENKSQAKAKAALKGGVGVAASMIILDPEEQGEKFTAHAVKAPVIDEYRYGRLRDQRNYHSELCGEIAECKEPSATVEGPIVQVLEHQGTKRLVVALPQSAVLISQVWLTTVAGWTCIAAPRDRESEILVYTMHRDDPPCP